MPQGADRGQKVARRILGVDAGLDGVAAQGELVLGQRQGFAGGDTQLPFHQVLAGDHLGDGMFHLQTRIHFHEVEIAALGDEFHRPGPDIADRARRGDGGMAHRGPTRRVEAGGRRFLDHFLVAALDRTVTFK